MLLTPKKAAEFVRVDEATVLSWIADGRLAALKLDNQTTLGGFAGLGPLPRLAARAVGNYHRGP